jgi:pilus assembly protein Flp/PilA
VGSIAGNAAGLPHAAANNTHFMEIVMRTLTNLVRSLAREEDGATMVEYGIMVALIAAVCIVIIGTLGGQVNTAFTTVSNALNPAG